MKLIYTAYNSMLVANMQNLLEGAGIECVAKNLLLTGGAGDIPLNEIWPELWVDESDFEQAQMVLNQAMADKSHLPPWQCPECNERVEGQFELCWSCGAARPEHD